jgi:hypothetical protein
VSGLKPSRYPGRRETSAKVLKDRRAPRERGRMGPSVDVNAPDSPRRRRAPRPRDRRRARGVSFRVRRGSSAESRGVAGAIRAPGARARRVITPCPRAFLILRGMRRRRRRRRRPSRLAPATTNPTLLPLPGEERPLWMRYDAMIVYSHHHHHHSPPRCRRYHPNPPGTTARAPRRPSQPEGRSIRANVGVELKGVRGGVERHRGRGLKARGGRRDAPGRVLKERRSQRKRGRGDQCKYERTRGAHPSCHR